MTPITENIVSEALAETISSEVSMQITDNMLVYIMEI